MAIYQIQKKYEKPAGNPLQSLVPKNREEMRPAQKRIQMNNWA